MTKELTARIMGSIEAVITPVSPDIALDAPIIAINWFDTRSLVLYNIYNFLASRSVLAVGGHVVVKGKILDVLTGAAEDQREVMLIVQYPSGAQFLSMVQSTYFQVVSLLRSAAVKRFTFGFTQPTAPASAKTDATNAMAYMIHHYRGSAHGKDLARLARENGVGVIYAGQSAARLSTRKPDTPDNVVPSLIDGAVIFQAETKAQLVAFSAMAQFQDLTNAADSGFSAIFKRLL